MTVDGVFRSVVLYAGEMRRESLYRPWLDPAGTAPEFIDCRQCRDVLSIAEAADIVLYHEYWQVEVCCLAQELVRRGKVPVLMLPDGIAEYRCVWEHQALGDGIGFIPVAAHKVACLGASQARLFDSWGNVGKCEVVGLPRLDGFASVGRDVRPPDAARERLVLVMTARTPAFSELQWKCTEDSLRDLAGWFGQQGYVQGAPVRPVWRVADRLMETLRLENPPWMLPGCSMADILATVDAVITTPSTAMLEAMLKGRPVALLDYHNVPHYVPAAWVIAAATQIGDVIHSMLMQDERRLLYQRHILRDSLAVGEGGSRMRSLAAAMVECGRQCRRDGRPVEFPASLIGRELPAVDVRHGIPLPALFPQNPYAQEDDIDHLRMLCSIYRKDNQRLSGLVQFYRNGMGPVRSWLLYSLYRLMRRGAWPRVQADPPATRPRGADSP